jgi:hypothetical protein
MLITDGVQLQCHYKRELTTRTATHTKTTQTWENANQSRLFTLKGEFLLKLSANLQTALAAEARVAEGRGKVTCVESTNKNELLAIFSPMCERWRLLSVLP